VVSVITATTAQPEIPELCLYSLLSRTTYRDFEVLVMVSESVVSKPERASLLRRFSKKSRLRISVYPDQTFNYSWVNNWGASQASGDVFCFLNDDTEVISPDWLEQLVARISLPGVVAAGPLLSYPDGTIQHAGVILGLGGVAGHACVHEPRNSCGYFGRACLEQDVSAVTAACMAVRADAFRSVDGFDEAMPLAYNDVDFCLRLRAAGRRIVWTPTVELIHRESMSLGRHDSRKNAAQFARDVAIMHQRWGALLQADPFYSPNLSLDRAYALAFPPHISSVQNLFR
jgi:GT2 family glycosyltransferase